MPGRESNRKKILVAEDNLINQKVATGLLELLGYSADVAQDGAEAVRLLEQGQYSAVLMDLHMPVMDGLTTTRTIRRLSGFVSRIPIIALTADTIHGQRQRCLAAGMDDFLSKPIDKNQFAASLAYWTSDNPEDHLLSA